VTSKTPYDEKFRDWDSVSAYLTDLVSAVNNGYDLVGNRHVITNTTASYENWNAKRFQPEQAQWRRLYDAQTRKYYHDTQIEFTMPFDVGVFKQGQSVALSVHFSLNAPDGSLSDDHSVYEVDVSEWVGSAVIAMAKPPTTTNYLRAASWMITGSVIKALPSFKIFLRSEIDSSWSGVWSYLLHLQVGSTAFHLDVDVRDPQVVSGTPEFCPPPEGDWCCLPAI